MTRDRHGSEPLPQLPSRNDITYRVAKDGDRKISNTGIGAESFREMLLPVAPPPRSPIVAHQSGQPCWACKSQEANAAGCRELSVRSGQRDSPQDSQLTHRLTVILISLPLKSI
ncbi:hypothetical protein RRG08_061869 [Elysia crispata]|uniref:Uncharacterized protein n=1 Tax=Elysia crispata TaxID=231223 RepID=A0AAE1CIS7_9GAST|nr:hypothetical protein RRG08_061869 [Elysia crispata]